MTSEQITAEAAATVLCCLSSASAGLGAAWFGCVLSWADHAKRQNGGRHTKKSEWVAIFGAIGSTVFGFSSLVGLYFGPVTLVVVIRAGSLLPANAVFSQLLGLRPLTRDDYLGTLVTISGVVCFSIFGGTPAQSPGPAEFVEMFSTCSALVCNIVLLVIFAISLVSLMGNDARERPLFRALAVTNIGGVSSAFMDLAAKGWSAALNRGVDSAWASPIFWYSLLSNVIFLISMRVSMIYGCKRCDVLLFVPLNTVLNMFYSVLAGMVVLQEWRQVISWPGLLGASTSVLGGVVMLVSGPATEGRSDDQSSEEMLPLASDAMGVEVVESLHADMSESGSPNSGRRSRRSLSTLIGERIPAMDSQLLSHITKGLRPELLKLNTAHREAARIRKKWNNIKSNLRYIVTEHYGRTDSVRVAAEKTPAECDDEASDEDWDDDRSSSVSEDTRKDHVC